MRFRDEHSFFLLACTNRTLAISVSVSIPFARVLIALNGEEEALGCLILSWKEKRQQKRQEKRQDKVG